MKDNVNLNKTYLLHKMYHGEKEKLVAYWLGTSNPKNQKNPNGKKQPLSFSQCPPVTPSLNEKIDSGNSHLQDLARWWRTSKGVHIPKISQFNRGLFGKTRFFVFLHYKIKQKTGKNRAKIPLNLASEGLKYAPEVRIIHETCSTICGTHVQAILNQKKLTRLAGGGQGRSK